MLTMAISYFVAITEFFSGKLKLIDGENLYLWELPVAAHGHV